MKGIAFGGNVVPRLPSVWTFPLPHEIVCGVVHTVHQTKSLFTENNSHKSIVCYLMVPHGVISFNCTVVLWV